MAVNTYELVDVTINVLNAQEYPFGGATDFIEAPDSLWFKDGEPVEDNSEIASYIRNEGHTLIVSHPLVQIQFFPGDGDVREALDDNDPLSYFASHIDALKQIAMHRVETKRDFIRLTLAIGLSYDSYMEGTYWPEYVMYSVVESVNEVVLSKLPNAFATQADYDEDKQKKEAS